jgi:hypothetical protein
MKIVRIEWLDSAQPVASWEFLRDVPAPKAHRCCTVGHLIHDGEEAKVVALSLGRNASSEEWDQAGGTMVIPACSIIRMDVISFSEAPYPPSG